MCLGSAWHLWLHLDAEAGLLLSHEIVNDSFLFEQIAFQELDSCLKARILRCQIIGGHFLFHDIIIKPLSVLMNDARAQFINVQVDLRGRFIRHLVLNTELFAKIELSLPTSRSRAALGAKTGFGRYPSDLLGWIVDEASGEHLLAITWYHCLLGRHHSWLRLSVNVVNSRRVKIVCLQRWSSFGTLRPHALVLGLTL